MALELVEVPFKLKALFARVDDGYNVTVEVPDVNIAVSVTREHLRDALLDAGESVTEAFSEKGYQTTVSDVMIALDAAITRFLAARDAGGTTAPGSEARN